MPWFDVHYSINGFVKIEAENIDEANEKTGKMLESVSVCVEKMLKTGCGVEIGDILQDTN